MSSQRQKITLDGVEFPAGFIVAAALIQSATEEADEVDDSSQCPMCGEFYSSYTTHLQRCDGG